MLHLITCHGRIMPCLQSSCTILPLMKNFVTLFSRTVRVTKLKPGTHMDSGPMYCVYQNQGQELTTLRVKSLDRFYNLP